ncbi:MAG: PTS sugar transporter subunit IIC [Defluviitaleaceae bacterium]|nr:PTS sugar transporter subunit IIC [Defluviitaleaceae bacterium]
MDPILLAFILATYAGLMIVFSLAVGGINNPLMNAMIVSLILGNPMVGLQVGAVCALMALGFHTFGGATIPDWNVGAMFATAIAIAAGGNVADVEMGIVIGSIVALLMTWFDILGRATTTVFQHGGDRALARRDVNAFQKWHLMGTIPWFLSRFIPVFIGALLIENVWVIEDFVNQYAWFRLGMQVIGRSLPAVGFALLLSFMDIKRFWPFLILGYALFAYMGVPTIGLAIIGVAAGALFTQMGKMRKEA